MAVQDLSASDLIRKISIRSDRYGDKLVEFMEAYNLMNLRDATVEQLQEFIKKAPQAVAMPTEHGRYEHLHYNK